MRLLTSATSNLLTKNKDVIKEQEQEQADF